MKKFIMALVLVALTMVTTHLVADEVFTDPARFTNDGYNFVMVETKMIMNATITQNFKLMQEAITYGFKLAGNFAHEGDVLMIRIYLSDNTTIAAVVAYEDWADGHVADSTMKAKRVHTVNPKMMVK